MNSRIDQRREAVDRIAGHLLAEGLGKTSVRQLAAAAGTSDRMLLYYFADKEDAMTAALTRVAELFVLQLEAAIPPTTRLAPADLFAGAVSLTTNPAMNPAMRLWIEIVAAAGRNEPPFRAVAESIATGFLDWLALRLDTDEARRDKEAAMILAMIEGLAVLDACTPTATRDAALEAMTDALR